MKASSETDSHILERIFSPAKPLEIYTKFIGEEGVEDIRQKAKSLKGMRLLHLNSTSSGGGVAELLSSVVPLLRSLGIDVEWRILCKDTEFFTVTKSFHNGLQGKEFKLTQEAKDIYLRRNRSCAKMLEKLYDIIVVNDPQPAAFRHFRGQDSVKWVWRCHIDTSKPNPEVWDFLKPFIEQYDVAVFTMKEFVPDDLSLSRIEYIPPAIDPLTSKNRQLPEDLCRQVIIEFGVDITRPFLLQVSRFDPWEDPLGVIEVYRQVKKRFPEVQLVLIGMMAGDDPEGWGVYDQIQREIQGDCDIHVLTNLNGVWNLEVNAFQKMSTVVIQKSIREGFGLTVSESLWKEAIVVGGNTGGIPLQIKHGENGYLVDSIETCVERVIQIMKNLDAYKDFRKRGREEVKEHFLITRLISDQLKLFHSLMGM